MSNFNESSSRSSAFSGFFLGWDNSEPPQLWVWKGEPGDETAEPWQKIQSEEHYVLVYIGDPGEWSYLGIVSLTDDINRAVKMTLDEARLKWNCMGVKADWQVWSIRPGITLDAMISV